MAEAWDGVLHELRLRGMMTGVAPADADALINAGFATRRGDRVVITPTGRVEADAAALLPAGSDEAARTRLAYDVFLPLNHELLAVTHAFQVRPGNVPNDHADVAYDWKVIDRLGALDERVGPVVRQLGQTAARFSGYRSRLRDARRRLEGGVNEWFASPRCDSYHTVWMQLHEDLLLALGLDRADEPGPGAARRPTESAGNAAGRDTGR